MKSLRVYLVEYELMCRGAVQSLLERRKKIMFAGASGKITSPLVSMLSPQSEDGLRATEIMSKKYSRTKVIIFTNFLDKESFTDAVPAGALGYLLKNNIGESNPLTRTIRNASKGNALWPL